MRRKLVCRYTTTPPPPPPPHPSSCLADTARPVSVVFPRCKLLLLIFSDVVIFFQRNLRCLTQVLALLSWPASVYVW